MLADQCERPLLQPKRGVFLYADFRPLGRAPVRREDRHVGADVNGIVAPVPRRDHPAVKVQNPLDLETVERGNRPPVPRMRERRNDAQALFTFGADCRAAFSAATSFHSSSMTAWSSASCALPGAQSSPQGVP